MQMMTDKVLLSRGGWLVVVCIDNYYEVPLYGGRWAIGFHLTFYYPPEPLTDTFYRTRQDFIY